LPRGVGDRLRWSWLGDAVGTVSVNPAPRTRRRAAGDRRGGTREPTLDGGGGGGADPTAGAPGAARRKDRMAGSARGVTTTGWDGVAATVVVPAATRCMAIPTEKGGYIRRTCIFQTAQPGNAA
jgi:hypothetical protein